MKDNSSSAATKQDLDELYERVEKMVGDVVGEVVGNALQMIAERFDKVDRKFAQIDKRFDRLEDKMDALGETVDHHTVDIRELRRKIA